MDTLNEKGPLILTHGKGIYVYDVKNRKYIDANSGLWNCVAGFDNKELVIENLEKNHVRSFVELGDRDF